MMSASTLFHKISNLHELDEAVAQRAQRLKFTSDFKAWSETTGDFYSFLAPNSSGIHVCARVSHPGSSSLAGYEDLRDLILGGSEVIFELTPQHQQSVRYCEMLLAILDEEVEARKIAHDSYALEILRNTDWSHRDGIGPRTLRSPAVIGYTDLKNLNKYFADKPAIIWSKHWQLSIDPIKSLLMRVGQIIEEHCRSFMSVASEILAPPAMDEWVDHAIIKLMQWVEDRRNGLTINLCELDYPQLSDISLKVRLTNEQIKDLCDRLAHQIRKNSLYNDWLAIFRAPAFSMFDKASLSFSDLANVMVDCWGYPFAFDQAFGSGVVKVRCEGLTATSSAEKQPLDLTEAMLFKLANECSDLDKTTRKPPSHYAVLRAALIERMNCYEMKRHYKWPRKTAELRLKKIETHLLHGTKISRLHVDPSIFKNVDEQLESARKRGRKVHPATLLDNTHENNSDENQE